MEGETTPANLNTSELGTKDYWDKYYQNNLNAATDEEDIAEPSELESWFDENGAPEKVLEYLTANDFPLSPENPSRAIKCPSVLDLGTGNGSFLFQLALEGQYQGRMVGVDYSQQSVDLARRIWKRYNTDKDSEENLSTASEVDIRFEQFDLLNDDVGSQSWWPKDGFDLVHDKGTFDAISLSSDTFLAADGTEKRRFEQYPGKVAAMVKRGGYLMVTSCNWTEDEVVRWFTETADTQRVLQVYSKVRYPVYHFGGQQGQGVASVCFCKASES